MILFSYFHFVNLFSFILFLRLIICLLSLLMFSFSSFNLVNVKNYRCTKNTFIHLITDLCLSRVLVFIPFEVRVVIYTTATSQDAFQSLVVGRDSVAPIQNLQELLKFLWPLAKKRAAICI